MKPRSCCVVENACGWTLRTADGVPIAPGMRIWPLHPIDGEEGLEIMLCGYDHLTGELLVHGDTLDIGACYSTPEAALAAQRSNEIIAVCEEVYELLCDYELAGSAAGEKLRALLWQQCAEEERA